MKLPLPVILLTKGTSAPILKGQGGMSLLSGIPGEYMDGVTLHDKVYSCEIHKALNVEPRIF